MTLRRRFFLASLPFTPDCLRGLIDPAPLTLILPRKRDGEQSLNVILGVFFSRRGRLSKYNCRGILTTTKNVYLWVEKAELTEKPEQREGGTITIINYNCISRVTLDVSVFPIPPSVLINPFVHTSRRR